MGVGDVCRKPDYAVQPNCLQLLQATLTIIMLDYRYINDDSCVPHGGFGLGIERILMKILNTQIREVVLFPRDRYRLTP